MNLNMLNEIYGPAKSRIQFLEVNNKYYSKFELPIRAHKKKDYSLVGILAVIKDY